MPCIWPVTPIPWISPPRAPATAAAMHSNVRFAEAAAFHSLRPRALSAGEVVSVSFGTSFDHHLAARA